MTQPNGNLVKKQSRACSNPMIMIVDDVVGFCVFSDAGRVRMGVLYDGVTATGVSVL